MDCSFKITRSNIVAELKKASNKYGIPVNNYITFIYGNLDENANLTDAFKEKLAAKFKVSAEELQSNKLDEVIKFITDEYNKVFPDVNYSADNETSYPQIAKYGYSSVYAREIGKTISLQLTLAGKRFIDEKYGSISNYIEDIQKKTNKKISKLEAYTRILGGKIVEQIKLRAKERGVSTAEEISELIKNRDIAKIEELFGKEDIESINLLALYKEYIADRDNFVKEVFKNDGKIQKLIYENNKLKEIEEAEDIENAVTEEEGHRSTNEDDAVDNYISNLTNKMGDVGHYMSNIDDNIRIFFSTIPTLTSTEPISTGWQYDTNNPLGIALNMDGTQCINVILSYANAYDVNSLKKEIKIIAGSISGMQGLVQVADYMDKHPDFAFKLWCNFSKTIMSKIETTNKSGNFQAAQSNISANRESVLKFDFINSFKHSFSILENEDLEKINNKFDRINKRISIIRNKLKDSRTQKEKDVINAEIKTLVSKAVPAIYKAFNSFFNTIQKSAIELFINENEDKLAAIKFCFDTFKKISSQAIIAQNNYAALQLKLDKYNEQRSKLNKTIRELNESLELDYSSGNIGSTKKAIKEATAELEKVEEKIKELYKTDFITDNIRGVISPFTNAIVKYSLVKTDLNSRNVYGNLSSDLINNSMITNILKTLQNPKALENFGKYRQQSRQYDFSNIMIEHRDENNKIINYGLFTLNSVTKEFTPTPYAHRLLKEALYSGIADVNNKTGASYAKMSGNDYITSAIFNFFNNEEVDDEKGNDDGGPEHFANYFMRVPSDAPKTFNIRASRYSIFGNNPLYKNKVINKFHPVYRQIRNIIVQEIQDAANAVYFIFKDNIIDGAIDPSVETLETGKEPTRLRRLYKNYHYKGNNLFKKDKNGKLILTGNVFSSDRFVITKVDENNHTSKTINYGQMIFDEALDFFYGGANSIKSEKVKGGVEIVLNDKQNEIIDKYISEFIKDYSEQCYERAMQNKHLFGEETFNKNDLTEFALNYFIQYVGFNDLFEGDTKFYKSSQDTVKRFKEAQGSGISYGLLNYEDDLTADSSPIKRCALNNTSFIKKVKNEDGSISEEEVKIEQRTRFKGVTIVNTVRTDESIGTFKLGKKDKPAKFIKNENGELVESDNGNYIFVKPGRLSNKLINALIASGMSKSNAKIHAANIMAGYADTTVNDAQSYITFEEWVRRISARGQLEEYKPLIDAIYDETKPLDAKTISKFVQVQKNFYYDQYYDAETGVIAPRQIKNAEFVLVPRLIEGTQLAEVYNMMQKASIDQLNTEETSKAGKRNVLTIWNENGEITEKDKQDFITNAAGAAELFNYNYLYTQQETPSHLNAKNKAGIQFMKKIIDNINPTLPNGKPNPLYKLKKKFQELYVDNIISSAEDFADEFGISIDEDGNFVLDEDHPLDKKIIYDLLRDEFARQGLDSNSQDYVTLDDDGFPSMPNYMGNFSKKLESIVQGLINNRITRQTLPGFHAAQITNIGFKPLNESFSKRSYSKELKYHPDEYALIDNHDVRITEREYNEKSPEEQAKYENIGASSYIEIMIPKSNFNFKRKTKDGKDKSDQELLQELRDSGADTIIGYRIPTEGKQSICIMKVIGFIDDTYDSTIVVPDAWVAQTGSDFDIDSIYAIHFTTQFDKDGKLILSKTKNVVPKDYIKYIQKKLKRILKKESIDTKITARLQDKIDSYNIEKSDEYDALKNEASEIYKTMKYTAQNVIKKYNKAEGKGETKRDKYISKLVHIINSLDKEIKTNDKLNKKEKYALKLYRSKLKDIHAFLKDQNSDFLEVLEENKTKITEETVKALSEIAVKVELPSYERFKERRARSINRDVRNNELLKTAIQILSDDSSLEENLSRSNFDKLIDARDDIQPDYIKEARQARSPYNIFDQAAYQEDVMSGATLKGASVARDTFVSVCNTIRPYINDKFAIRVTYRKEDGYTLNSLRKIFDKVTDNGNGTFTVIHNTIGWTKNDKNVDDLLLTPYTSQTTAHILDAVKEGPIPNVNNYTFNVYKTFSDLGCSFHTAVAFMLQSAVKRIVEYNNKKNSVFIQQDNNNPIKSTIVELTNKLLPKANFTVFSKLSDIAIAIENEYGVDLKTITVNPYALNQRLDSTEDNIENTLHDLQVAFQFYNIKKLSDEISNKVKLVNPDKFGAKQTIFETIDIIRKIDEAKSEKDPIIYVQNENGTKTPIIASIYTSKVKDSSYPSLNAFYNYSTKLSVALAKLLFTDTHSEEFDDFMLSIERSIGKKLDESAYNSFRSYVLSYVYKNAPAIKNTPVVNENSEISFDEPGDDRAEVSRIYGLNRLPYLHVKNSDNRTVMFNVEDINHPTIDEIRQFITLSPAQKVNFIKNTFLKKGIFDYIEETLTNRGKLSNKQTLTFKENSVDVETIYSEFEKAFFNSNPLIRLAAIDLVKYAYVVEGFKMKRGAINKVIKNNAIYLPTAKKGLNIPEHSNNKIKDLSDIGLIDEKNELRLNFIRSHSDLITTKTILYHETDKFYDKEKTKPIFEKDLIPTSKGIIIVDDIDLMAKYKIITVNNDDYIFNQYINLKDKNNTTLYKIYEINDSAILIPLNKLEENEFAEMSVNRDNNKFERPSWYFDVIHDYRTRLIQQEEEIRRIEMETQNEEQIEAVEKDPKYTIKSSISSLMAQADLHKYLPPKVDNSKYAKKFDINAKDTPYTVGFEKVINAVTERFDEEKGKLLILRSPALANFITYQSPIFGSIQTINGNEYLIQRNYYKDKNDKYIKNKEDVKEANKDLKEIFTEAQKKNEPVRDIFAITKVNVTRRSSTDELSVDDSNNDENELEVTSEDIRRNSSEEINAIPDVNSFNFKAIETMYFRRSSLKDPLAISAIKFMDNKDLRSDPNYLETHKTLISKIISDYIVNSVNNIINALNNFQIGDKTYRIDSDEVIEAIKTNPELKQRFLQTILDARAFATRFAIINQIDITSENPEVAKQLQNIKKVIGELTSSNIIANCEVRFGNEVLAKLSNNPLAQKDILGVFDGYHTATLIDAWVNDLQETTNPLLQIVSSQVMKDLRKKEMLAQKEVIAFRKAIADIKSKAAKAGVKIDWDHIIDDEGKFIQAYNQIFLDKLQELKEKRDKAKQEIDVNPLAYYKAKLEFDKWKLENINQEANNNYYATLIQLEEEMINNYPTVYVKFKELQTRQSELLNYINGGTLNKEYADELANISKELNNLSNDYITDGDSIIYKHNADDPYNPFTGERKNLYSLESARALKNYRTKKSELDEAFFEHKSIFNFDKELEKNLRIITEREKRDPNGKLLTPTSELMEDPDYVAAKEWIVNNTIFTRSSEVREKLNEAFKALKENKTNSRANINPHYVSAYAKLRDAYDMFGVVNARKLTDSDIDNIRRHQFLEYNLNEENPFSDRTLISNSPDDDVIFKYSFYNRMKSDGSNNLEYLAKIDKINNILRPHYDSVSKVIRTSELTTKELKDLAALYKDLNDIKKIEEGTSTNGKSVYEFIKNNVEFKYNYDQFNEEKERAEKIAAKLPTDQQREYMRQWRNANMEIVEDEDGNDIPVPNHYIYGYAVPKGYEKGKDNPFIDKKKTEALRYIKEHSSIVETEYYHQTYREISAKSKEEFQEWFDKNHIYNPYTRKLEPLKCWTTLEVHDENQKELYAPKFNYKERKVKNSKRNPNYVEDMGYAKNYNGRNSKYNNTISQNVYEKELSDLLKSKIEKYSITDQARSFYKQGYAPLRQKDEEMSKKKIAKELLKFAGYVNTSTGREDWIADKDIDYSKDNTMNMPMTTLLKSKETVDIKKNAPRRKKGELIDDYNKRYNEWYEQKKKDTAKNREIHKALLDKNWESVFEEFIIKASKFNAVQDNKYLLFYAKNVIDNQKTYVSNLGFSKFQKTGKRTIDNTIEYDSKVDQNTQGQYINWLRRILYEQYKKPNNQLTRFANVMQSFTSAKYMMGNLGGGIGNITQGWNQILGERYARDYFGSKNWWKGVADWNTHIGSFIYDMYKPTASSFESGIVKLFNVVDFTEINGLVEIKDSSKYIDRARDVAFSTLSVGEHFMQNSALFTMLRSHRLYFEPSNAKDGKLVYVFKSEGQALNEAMDVAFRKMVEGTKYAKLYDEFVKYETSKPDYKKEYVWFREDFTTKFVTIYMQDKMQEFKKLRKEEEKKISREFNNDVNHPTLRDQLELDKDGYIKFKDDSILATKMSEKDAMELLAAFKGRVISVNKKIHGIYDKLGAAQLENKWAGSLAMQYHKHIYPGIMKRWRRQGYFNEERGTVEKGSNIALLDFIALPFNNYKFVKKLKADNNMSDSQLNCIEGIQNICKSYLEFFTHFNLYYSMLPRYEQANILRGFADLTSTVLAVAGAVTLQILGADDDNNGLFYDILVNQADRLATESMAFRSVGIIGESKKLWSSPIAAQTWIEDTGKLLSLCTQYIMEGDEFEPEYTTGMYKGENKFGMLLKRNIPFWHSIYMLERLRKNNKNYKLDENMLSIIPVKSIAEYIKD